MKFDFNPDDEAFRDTVRQFCAERLPADIAMRTKRGFHPPPHSDTQYWNRTLFEQGWSAPHWPVAFGGTGWSALRRHIFEEETYRAGAPELSWQGLRLVGPVICAYGSKEQQERFLPGILSGGEYWVQGFSEPGSGSDLASLKTSARRAGDNYIVNGQKIWSSEAQYARWGFFLVRTSSEERPQRGISMLLVDMNTPGITVRPITLIDGGQEVNEIFLDDVVVPVANRIGEEGKGWSYAKFLLENERTSGSFIHSTKRGLAKLKEIAADADAGGKPIIEQAVFRQKLAQFEMDVLALEWSVLRVLAKEQSAYDAVAIASALKLRGGTLHQRMTELQVEALGPLALRFFEHDYEHSEEAALRALWPEYAVGTIADHFFARALTIAGGTNEIQKNIIAKVAFHL